MSQETQNKFEAAAAEAGRQTIAAADRLVKRASAAIDNGTENTSEPIVHSLFSSKPKTFSDLYKEVIETSFKNEPFAYKVLGVYQNLTTMFQNATNFYNKSSPQNFDNFLKDKQKDKKKADKKDKKDSESKLSKYAKFFNSGYIRQLKAADDEYSPESIQTQIQKLEDYKEGKFLERFDEEEREKKEKKNKEKKEKKDEEEESKKKEKAEKAEKAEKEGKKDKKEKKSKEGKKDKKEKKDKKDKKGKKEKKDKKGKKDKKDKKDKSDKKDKKDKGDKKDKKHKKDKKEKDGEKEKKDDKKEGKSELEALRKYAKRETDILDGRIYELKALTSPNELQTSISRFAPALQLLDLKTNPDDVDPRANTLRKASELQLSAESCYRQYLHKLVECQRKGDAACLIRYRNLEFSCINKSIHSLKQLASLDGNNNKLDRDESDNLD